MIKPEDLEIGFFPFEGWAVNYPEGRSILHKPSGTFVAVDKYKYWELNLSEAMKILKTQLHALGAEHNPS